MCTENIRGSMITFRVCDDMCHETKHVFKHVFMLSVESPANYAMVSKKARRVAIYKYMSEFGPCNARWAFSVGHGGMFVYIRFKDDTDAMMFKLIKG